jgi:riboflavin biosynthesis protein RibD
MSDYSPDDYRYMSRALQLARKGLYTTDPNPRVGCVLVHNGKVIAEGYHARAGAAHAEIVALQQAGEAAAGATVYVTLEPCCHHGRTPPCTDALIQAGVHRVVVAMEDPDPRVAGKGMQHLLEAGIIAENGLLAAQAQRLNPGFVMRMRLGRPFVRCKLAMSLDGRTATASGESRWITDEAARRDVQHLRARSSAIMTGIGTVLADDPALTVRLDAPTRQALGMGDEVRQPLRVVLDSYLSIPEKARMLHLAGETVIVTAAHHEEVTKRLTQAGATVVRLPAQVDAIDLNATLNYLAKRAINEVLLESGATLSGAMLRSGLVDELVIYLAPHIMGHEARSLFRLPGLERMVERIELDILEICAVGRDWRIRAKVRNSGTDAITTPSCEAG